MREIFNEYVLNEIRENRCELEWEVENFRLILLKYSETVMFPVRLLFVSISGLVNTGNKKFVSQIYYQKKS